MRVRFLSAAQVELDEAVDWYEAESVGLGRAFLTEVLSSLDRIREFPHAWHLLSKDSRRCQTRRFPYGVIYTVEYETVIVLAIANLHRKPDYWRDRLALKGKENAPNKP